MSDFDAKEMFRLQHEYKKRFGDTFPMMFCLDPIVDIKKCLKEGKPYDPYEGIVKKGEDRSKISF